MTITTTPELQFEESTGYLSLFDGETRRIVLRKSGNTIYLWWRVPGTKREVPVLVEDFLSTLQID